MSPNYIGVFRNSRVSTHLSFKQMSYLYIPSFS